MSISKTLKINTRFPLRISLFSIPSHQLLLPRAGGVRTAQCFVILCFASPSAVPWCARDGVPWMFPMGGSKSARPRPTSQRWPCGAETNGREVAEPSEPTSEATRNAPPASRGTRGSPGSCKTRISQLERALEAMGGMEGPAAQAIKVELDKAKSASKRPPLNVEIE